MRYFWAIFLCILIIHHDGDAQNYKWASASGVSSLIYEKPSVSLDLQSNVYTCGYFENQVDLDPGSDSNVVTSKGLNDFFIQKLDASGKFLWGHSFGSKEEEFGISSATDKNGNLFITGYFIDTIDFDFGPNKHLLIPSTYLLGDIFICKYNPNGGLVWAKRIGGQGEDVCKSLAIDTSGNLYLTGTFSQQVDFDPDSNVNELISSFGYADIFILKLNNDGHLVYIRRFAANDIKESNSIAVNISGEAVLTGWFRTTLDVDPDQSSASIYSNGGKEIFVVKLDTNGFFKWAHRIGSWDEDVGKDITCDDDNSVYITGWFSRTVDFNPGNGVASLTSNQYYTDIFILKLTAAGNFVWVSQLGGTNSDVGWGIAVDQQRCTYITGNIRGTVDLSTQKSGQTVKVNGLADAFIMKLDVYGATSWSAVIGGAYEDQGTSIAVDSNGNIYNSGYFAKEADMDPDSTVKNLSLSKFAFGVFTLKLGDCSKTLTSQPISKTQNAGHIVAFDVQSSSNTTQFRWQQQQGSIFIDLKDSGRFNGTKSTHLEISPTQLSDNNQRFRCIASDDACTAISDTAILQVQCSKQISLQPSDAHAFLSETTSFYTSTFDTALFQWQIKSSNTYYNLSNAGPYQGVNSNQLKVTANSIALSGSFFRCLVSNYGCVDTSEQAKLLVTYRNGLSDIASSDNISIYPNPSTNKIIYIETSGKTQEPIQIFDLLGKLVHTEWLSPNELKTINLTTLPSGVYILRKELLTLKFLLL